MKYANGWVACIQNNDGSRFPNGSLFLYSEPHPTERQARDWVWAHNSITKDGVKLVRLEKNQVPVERLVQPEDREAYEKRNRG